MSDSSFTPKVVSSGLARSFYECQVPKQTGIDILKEMVYPDVTTVGMSAEQHAALTKFTSGLIKVMEGVGASNEQVIAGARYLLESVNQFDAALEHAAPSKLQ